MAIKRAFNNYYTILIKILSSGEGYILNNQSQWDLKANKITGLVAQLDLEITKFQVGWLASWRWECFLCIVPTGDVRKKYLLKTNANKYWPEKFFLEMHKCNDSLWTWFLQLRYLTDFERRCGRVLHETLCELQPNGIKNWTKSQNHDQKNKKPPSNQIVIETIHSTQETTSRDSRKPVRTNRLRGEKRAPDPWKPILNQINWQQRKRTIVCVLCTSFLVSKKAEKA